MGRAVGAEGTRWIDAKRSVLLCKSVVFVAGYGWMRKVWPSVPRGRVVPRCSAKRSVLLSFKAKRTRKGLSFYEHPSFCSLVSSWAQKVWPSVPRPKGLAICATPKRSGHLCHAGAWCLGAVRNGLSICRPRPVDAKRSVLLCKSVVFVAGFRLGAKGLSFCRSRPGTGMSPLRSFSGPMRKGLAFCHIPSRPTIHESHEFHE
jgi:hypothetical protein